MKFLKLMVRNVFRNRRRALLTGTSVAISVFLISMLLAVLAGFDQPKRNSEHLRLVVRNAVSLQIPLPERLREELARVPHVTLVYAHDWFGGIYKDTRQENFFPQFACDAHLLTQIFDELRFEPGDYERFVADRTGFVCGADVARKHGWSKGTRITLQGTFWPFNPELTLDGIFESDQFSEVVFFNRAYAEESVGRPGIVGVFWIKVDKPENMAGVMEAIDGKYRNSPHETHTETEQAFRLSFVQMMGNIQGLIKTIGLAVLFTIVLICANTMAMSARERGVEIAVLRVLGFGRGRILSIVLGESLFLSLAGGVVGSGAAWILLGLVSKSARGMMFMLRQMVLTPATLAEAVGITLTIGLLAGLAPAFRASRTSIVDGLRKVA